MSVPTYLPPETITAPVPEQPAQEVPATFLPQPPVPLPVYEQVPQIADQAAVASVQVPEGGYAQRFVKIPLPQLHIEGVQAPWIELRNPGLMAPDVFDEMSKGLAGVTENEAGEPLERDQGVILATMCRMLRHWSMWDGTSDEDVPPQLPEPITPELLNKAPLETIKAIGRAFRELANPQ